MRRTIIIAVIGLAMLSGCGDNADTTTTAAPTAAPASSPSASPTKAVPAGATACKLVGAAIAADTLMDEGVVDEIVADTKRASPFLRAAGTRLGAAYRNAVEAEGKPTESRFVLSVRQSAGQMAKTCATSNFPTS